MTDGVLALPYDAIIGLGSNIGDKAGNIAAAIAAVTADDAIRVVARSRTYRTPPWGVTDQAWFANACVGVATSLSAREVLGRCQAVETAMGRVRAERWGPRVIDLDVLIYRDAAIDEPDFVVPHPRLAERAFVLVPLAELAPDLRIGGRTVTERLAGLDRTGISPIE